MSSSANFNLTNTVKAKLPRLAFTRIDGKSGGLEDVKDAVLGAEYDLTLTIIGVEEMRALNFKHRGINEPTDILSFPLDEQNGEIYINLEHTELEAKKFMRSYENFFAFLFIHGLVHLKGIDHGSTMERIEAKFRKQFGV